MEGCYLIHFSRRYKHAGHYTGWAADIDRRFREHQKGGTTPLIDAVLGDGIELVLAATWPGEGKAFERKLKRRKKPAHHCPVCKANARKARGE